MIRVGLLQFLSGRRFSTIPIGVVGPRLLARNASDRHDDRRNDNAYRGAGREAVE